MRKKEEGDTLGEKIEHVLERLKKKNVSQLIGDCFYEQVYEQGIPFYVRTTNLLREEKAFKKNKEGDTNELMHVNRTINVPDE